MGPKVAGIEEKLSNFCGSKNCLSCSSGTDALVLALMARGVGLGDCVLVPSFTFVASAEAVVIAGARPIFVDVDENTMNMSPKALEEAIKMAHDNDLDPKGVIVVDLFGLPADYDNIIPIAKKHDMFVLSDAAQSFGGEYKGTKVGNIGDITTTSFYPAKPLGCYGDGGAVFTNSDEEMEALVSMRVHGGGGDKYDNIRIGINGRMDAIQAAVLLEKMKIFDEEIELREKVAKRYQEGLKGIVKMQEIPEGSISAWAQFTILAENRDDLGSFLKERGIPTAYFYPKPCHAQTAYKDFMLPNQELKISDYLADNVVSLPMHPYLEEDVQDHIIEAITDYFNK